MINNMCNEIMAEGMDKIRIENLEVFAHHGVFEKETQNGQNFYVNACLYTDTRRAGQSDELTDSTHYGEVCHFIDRYMRENTWKLIESVAEQTAREVLLHFPGVSMITLEIRKPSAPIGLPFASVSVEVTRGWQKAVVAFGSNMGERERYIDEAVRELRSHKQIRLQSVSDIFRTKPYGGVAEGEFLNGAVLLETLLRPEELLDFLHQLENQAGRERKVHWGSRTLDLDIILYGNRVMDTEILTIPHRDMINRSFVLEPVSQIAGGYRHPLYGKTISELWEAFQQKN